MTPEKISILFWAYIHYQNKIKFETYKVLDEHVKLLIGARVKLSESL